MKFLIVITYYSGTGKVPAPFSTKELIKSNNNEGGSNQKEILFNLGNAISGLPQCIGKK